MIYNSFSVTKGLNGMTRERDYFFDNLKAVLIYLVVLGHFLLPIRGANPLVEVKRLIYVFHMPLFVFVSGYFAKKSTGTVNTILKKSCI